MFQVNGQLAVPVSGKLMTPGRRQAGNIGKALSCFQFHQPLLQFPAAFRTQVFLGFDLY
jgi:hypothetical protein